MAGQKQLMITRGGKRLNQRQTRLKMAKDPAVLFYTSDFLSGTMTMDDEHVGMYIRLLCLQHQAGRLSEKDMLKICKTYVDDVFKKFVKDEDGFYYNERMESEALKRKTYCESRSNNRKKSKINKLKEKHMLNTCNSYVQHMENENENINAVKTTTTKPTKRHLYSELFEEFWSIYPKHRGKAEAQIEWNKIKDIKTIYPLIKKALDWQTKSTDWLKENGQYIPEARRYLKRSRWTDEPTNTTKPKDTRKFYVPGTTTGY
jgi:uncharacterized protein YdaU (DUF1376 family)